MRKLLYVLTLIFAFSFGITAYSANDDIRVYDNAGLFTGSEYNRLTDACLDVGEKLKLDIIILTIDNAQGKTSEEFADDFYDDMAFGYDTPNGDGILFLIDMDNREGYISTSGKAIYYFTDERIELILDDIFRYLPYSDYYNSCTSFINGVSNYMWSEPDLHSSQPFFTVWWIQLIIALSASGIIVGIMAYSSSGRVTVTGSTYLNSNSTHNNSSYDNYIKTVTTSVKKQSTQKSGGSSTHKSSSGHTHGGGGRKF